MALFSWNSIGQNKVVEINPDKTYQRINNFTASDAWSGNFVGKYWGEDQKKQIAEWLFSTQFDESGNPKGIGLSMWRVNLGAGTFEQENADILPMQRRAESFLTVDGKNYDWGKCVGQQYFMRKAKEYGCNNFLLFSNSPLIQYTLNGKGYAGSMKANLKEDSFTAYADYLTTVITHFSKDGFNIQYLSPINEPQLEWNKAVQEGSPWRSGDIYKLISALDKSMIDKQIVNTKIYVGEACGLEHLYDSTWVRKRFNYDDGPDLMIKTFFDPQSKTYLGEMKSVAPLISGHSYGSHTKNKRMREVRQSVAHECRKYNIPFQESEWCMLPELTPPMDGFTQDWYKGNRTDIQVALLLGRIIYSDLVDANAEGWGYWKGMEINGDHALITLLPKNNNLLNGGTVLSNKILWALGNYSLFIRPGYQRIETNGADDLNSVVISSFISPQKDKLVIVAVNSGFKSQLTKIELPKSYLKKIRKVSEYRTDRNSDLTHIGSVELSNIIIPSRALLTIVVDLN